jgi:cytosine/adenosine deaminase-related metal-dependent hydrolase
MLPRVGEPDHTRWPRGRDVLDMATRNGAVVLGLENRAGRIAVGQLADLVLLRCRTAGTLALEPGADALVQHGGPEWVDSVMVDGRWWTGAGSCAVGSCWPLTKRQRWRTPTRRSQHCTSAPQHSWRCWTRHCRNLLRRSLALTAA